jgi:hypothetical protein
METIRLFVGHDARESVGLHVFLQSVLERSSLPVAVTPLTKAAASLVGGQRDGTNAFSFSRFLVPYLCGFNGFAVYADGVDMLVRADLAELWNIRDPYKAVQVVKRTYTTKAPRKYLGTSMEADNRDYPRKNWSSLVIWNCGHYMNRILTPEMVSKATGEHLHRFALIPDERIGDLPAEWNHLVGELDTNPDAKLAHFTLGIPGFINYAQAEFAGEWRMGLENVLRGNSTLTHSER